MAEETKESGQEMDAKIESTNDSLNKNETNESKRGGRKNNQRRDDKPIEEMFDLTKPIPRVERPSKEKHEAEILMHQNKIEQLKQKRNVIQNEIQTLNASNKVNSEISQLRDKLSQLKSKKGITINEKKAIRKRLDSTRQSEDKAKNEKKAVKQNLKFSTVEEIDREILRLNKRQETTSMSLQEEKKLIKEIDALQASKMTVKTVGGKVRDINNLVLSRKEIQAELKRKDLEIDAIQAEIDEAQKLMDVLNKNNTENRDARDKLYASRDEIKALQDIEYNAIREARNEFRAANDVYYSHQRAIKAQRKLQFEEERKKREEEEAAYQKKLEEEEMKKVPYEEEQALCEYLANYLQSTYLDKNKSISNQTEKKSDIVAVKDDPFAGMTAVNKKVDDVFLQMGSGKKPRERKAKKEKRSDMQAPFRLNVDSFDQFGLLNLDPPMNLEEVPASVEALKAKKIWYSQQPRGSVPTATEIRRANEKAAKKLSSSGNSGAGKEERNDSSHGGRDNKGSRKKKAASKFALSDDDFAPLSATTNGSGSGVNSSWGQVGSVSGDGSVAVSNS